MRGMTAVHAWRGARLLLGALLGALAALTRGADALAQEAGAEAPAVGSSVGGYDSGDWLNLVVRLALVLLVIWVAIAAMRWWMRRMNGTSGDGSGRMLQVLESRSLGPNRSLQLVKLGNRAVLLGVTNERINAVLEVTDPAEVERLATPAKTADPTSFRDAIARLGALTRRGSESASGVAMAQPEAAPARVSPIPQATMATNGSVPQRSGNRWLRLARWVVGLEDGPRGLGRQAASQGAGVTARAPITGGVAGRSSGAVATSGGRLSPAERATLAAELPASRAARAQTGYRQNQIAEAQRAISTTRDRRVS